MKTLLYLFFSLLSLNSIAQKFHINENFDQSNLTSGWSNNAISGTQTWSFGIDGASVHSNNQNLDGTPMAYFDDDALGSSVSNNHVELLTPTFNNAGFLNTFLEFDYNFRENGSSAMPDSFVVEVFDGNQWQMVLHRDFNFCGNYLLASCIGNFPHAKIDISAFQNANCRVRFRYYDGNDSLNQGWYVGLDNVKIHSPFHNDLRVSKVITPVSSCDLSTTETVEVQIINEGSDTTSSFPIAFAVNGTEIATETVNASLAYQDTLTYQFNTPANLSLVGQYLLSAYTKLTNDSLRTNDTTQLVIQSDSLYSLPYHDNFENQFNAWTVNGVNASWQKGVPSGIFIDTAASGIEAWVTNLSGNYNNNENAYLTSPCLSFSNKIGIPILSFSMQYQTQSGLDKAWMEYSLDGGQSWSKLMVGAYSKNWYNNSQQNVWEGSNSTWTRVENSLDSLQGLSQLQLRFVFQSDDSTQFEGIGIDSINISAADGKDLQILNLLYPVLDTSIAECPGLFSKEFMEIEILNIGIDTVRSFIAAFQKNGSTPQFDTVRGVTILPMQSYQYRFKTPITFPQAQIYPTDVWIQYANDTDFNNDTLSQINFDASYPISGLLTPPIIEDFEQLSPPAIPANWLSTSNNTYYWLTATGNTSPSLTTGPNSPGNKFIYTDSDNSGGSNSVASLQTPCISTHEQDTLSLRYNYHKYGIRMGDLIIDVFDGLIWHNGLDTIIGETHSSSNDAWKTSIINLDDFVNRTIKVRFRGTHDFFGRGDMAIDNVSILSLFDKDIKLTELQHIEYNCELLGNKPIQIKLTNEGRTQLIQEKVYLNYQINGDTVVQDSMLVSLDLLKDTLFTFSQIPNYNNYSKPISFQVWLSLPGDGNLSNDTISKSYNYKGFPYFEDFEDATVYNNQFNPDSIFEGWLVDNPNWGPNNYFSWRTAQGSWSSFAGPSFDHTLGNNGLGTYFVADFYQTTGISTLNSPCIQLDSSLIDPYVSFWYHRFGQNMSDLKVDVYNYGSGLWDTSLMVISGPTQTTQTSPWKKDSISLAAYQNQIIKVRFRIEKSLWNAFDVSGIDDIHFYDSSMTTSIKEHEFSSKISQLILYPNPSQGIYFLQFKNESPGLIYQVYDLNAKLVYSGNIRGNEGFIDLKAFPNGIYFLHIPELNVKEKLIKH